MLWLDWKVFWSILKRLKELEESVDWRFFENIWGVFDLFWIIWKYFGNFEAFYSILKYLYIKIFFCCFWLALLLCFDQNQQKSSSYAKTSCPSKNKLHRSKLFLCKNPIFPKYFQRKKKATWEYSICVTIVHHKIDVYSQINDLKSISRFLQNNINPINFHSSKFRRFFFHQFFLSMCIYHSILFLFLRKVLQIYLFSRWYFSCLHVFPSIDIYWLVRMSKTCLREVFVCLMKPDFLSSCFDWDHSKRGSLILKYWVVSPCLLFFTNGSFTRVCNFTDWGSAQGDWN
jgi:hypothetical protein